MLRRVTDTRRENFEKLVMDQGLVYNETVLPDGKKVSYWNEGVFYTLTAEETEALHQASALMFSMCIEAGDYLVTHPEVMIRMGIPEWTHKQIIRTWNLEPARGSLYGRFDVRFANSYGLREGTSTEDPTLNDPKLLEFNADTPTAIVESARIQWFAQKDAGVGTDQWNGVEDLLIAAWKRNLKLLGKDLGHKPTVYFAYDSNEASGEDLMTTEFLRDTCDQAGYQTVLMTMQDIGWTPELGFHDDRSGTPAHIDVIFKLYPWEWMIHEEFGRTAFLDMEQRRGTIWIEPPYKMLWSNKGLLAVLWQLFGDDLVKSRLLLPTYFEADRPAGMVDYARKPLLGREGANVSLMKNNEPLDQGEDKEYGAEGFVVQALAPLPNYPGPHGNNHPVLGIWIVDGEPAGLGIRESDGLVTDNLSRFTPNAIEEISD
jgi:glutathionylspermidine synthase